jgi:hypothetical protein
MAERRGYRRIIFFNILHALRIVLEAMVVYKFDFEIEENKVPLLARHSAVSNQWTGCLLKVNELLIKVFAKHYKDIIFLNRKPSNDGQFLVEYLAPFKSLWADQGVQRVVKRGNEFALHDNMS